MLAEQTPLAYVPSRPQPFYLLAAAGKYVEMTYVHAGSAIGRYHTHSFTSVSTTIELLRRLVLTAKQAEQQLTTTWTRDIGSI